MSNQMFEQWFRDYEPVTDNVRISTIQQQVQLTLAAFSNCQGKPLQERLDMWCKACYDLAFVMTIAGPKEYDYNDGNIQRALYRVYVAKLEGIACLEKLATTIGHRVQPNDASRVEGMLREATLVACDGVAIDSRYA